MPEPVRGDQKYLPGLDGLRALAVAAVVAYHLGFGWAQGGLLGVGVFFTLSGYLITDILAGQWAKAGRLQLKDFWLRRARRLLPALFVMLTVVALLVNTGARAQLPGFRGDVIASALYVSNWWYIGQHASYYAQFAPPAPLDHLWSLAVEEQFYLVWPWLVLLGLWLLSRQRGGDQDGSGVPASGYIRSSARWRLAVVTLVLAAASAVAMAVLYLPGFDPTRVYEGTDTRACGLLIGAALALVWPTRRNAALPARATRALDAAGLAGLAVVGVLIWRTNQYSPFMFRGGLVVLSVATAAAVGAAAAPGGLLGVALGWAPLRWLGVRSYGIYLWHYPVIVLTAPPPDSGGMSVTRAVLTAAASVALAAISWKYVEEPVRRGFIRSRSSQPGQEGAGSPARRRLFAPLVVGGLCLLAAGGIAGGVTAVTSRPTSGTTASVVNPATTSGAALRQPASPASARHTAHGSPSPARSATARAGGPQRTSCQSVVHMGDSTSEGLISRDYLPNAAQRIPAQYAKVGVSHSIMEISGGTSIVETINHEQNEYSIAKRLVAGGYNGCWVLALGTNDTADVYVGSSVSRVARIREMMSVIGDQPVMWVAVKSLLSGGPYSEQNMMLWNEALQQAQPQYPNMRIYDWPSAVRTSWFINDGIHYTSRGYAQRARLIAAALAAEFPAN